MSRRRVAITGLGMVTPVGNDVRSTWASLCAGRSGLAAIKGFDASGFPVRIGAEVKNFNTQAVRGDSKLLKFASRTHRFALTAAEEALRDAGIRPDVSDGPRWGCSVGAGMMALPYTDLESVRSSCAPDGEFHPDALVSHRYSSDPVSFCRSQAYAGLALLTRTFGIQGYAT